VISFARDSRGRLRPDRGPEWDAAELDVVPGLQELGYRDAYRTLHPHNAPEPSWTWQRIAGHHGGWRIDHILATRILADKCRTAEIDLTPRKRAKPSDHTVMWAEFD